MAKGMLNEWEDDEDKLLLLESWARAGLSDQDIASNIGINVRTLYRWRNKSVRIRQSLKNGKEVADYKVENALYKKAIGFTAIDKVVSTKRLVEYKDGKRVREISVPVVVEIERYYPPDTVAEIFWLKNRKPELWREKQEIASCGVGKVEIVDGIPEFD